MLEALLQVVLPVFIVAGVGFVYAGTGNLPVKALTDLIMYVTGACLVFDALASAEPIPLGAVRVPITVGGVILATMLLSVLAHRFLPWMRPYELGAVLLPVSFMNAGNLGLPLVSLAFGKEGFEVGMLYFVTFASLMYSVGVAVMAGRAGLNEAFKLPLMYAAILGIAFNQWQVQLPRFVEVPVHMLGQTVIPFMLISLGGRLRSLFERGGHDLPWLPMLTVVCLRMGGGFLASFFVSLLVGNEGLTGKVALLVGMLPPAVMNFAVVEKYGRDPSGSSMVSGSIAIGTVTAVLVLPFVIPALR